MKVRHWSYELPFEFPFTISRGTKTHQPTLITEISHFGLTGYGEAPAISYYDIPVSKMVSDLMAKKLFVEKYAFTEPERYWHYLHHLYPRNSFLVCALDIAAWDLYGKMRRQPLWQLWGYDRGKSPLTDYTIGLDTPQRMLEKLRLKPWPVYKVKLGSPSDMDIVRMLREQTDAVIRVDANGGWKREEARRMLDELAELGVELVEQPLDKEDKEGIRDLYAYSKIPLIADESCVTEADVANCHGSYHGINIKLTKCGGITPARRMIARARELELKIMIGSMNESTVGTAAIAHLIPAADYADADGPLLLSDDLAVGLNFEEGRVEVSSSPGLGIEFLFTDKNLLEPTV